MSKYDPKQSAEPETEATDEADAGAPRDKQETDQGYVEEKPADAEAARKEAAGDPPDEWTALQNERDELYARLQRVSADYSNYMKRAQSNLNESLELSRGELIKQLLPVLDHFDNALGQHEPNEETQGLYDGMRIVRDELLRVLTNNGVQRIEPSVGEPFDPNQHEAMMRQPAEGVEPNHVSGVMQPGYTMGSRTLRAAKVAVAPEA